MSLLVSPVGGNHKKKCIFGRILLVCSLLLCFALVEQANRVDSRTVAAVYAQQTEQDGEQSIDEAVEPLRFSHAGGFYTSPFQLTLSTSVAGASIHYTTDGSEPTINSPRYTGPIFVTSRAGEPNVLSLIQTTIPPQTWMEPTEIIFKATTIRARLIGAGGEASPILTHTYFVDPAGADRYSLPVVSIVTDADNFFDPEIGIYVPGNNYQGNPDDANYMQSGREWERPVHIELFTEDGTRVLAQNAGVRIHGGFSRSLQSKSLRFYARDDYGPETFNAQLFRDRPFSNYETFILRNAGNDWGLAHYRDGLAHCVVEPLTLDTQAFRPVVAFLNGEYWGLLGLRERQDAAYLETHHGIPSDAVDMLELPDEVSEGSDAHYRALIEYVEANGASSTESYAYIEMQMDLDNFIDYTIVEIFSNNRDWPHNNAENWRYQAESYDPDAPYGFDGRWRWFIKDMDFGYGYDKGGDATTNTLVWATSPDGNGLGAWSTLLLRSLLENETFRHKFINRFADLLNTIFVTERMMAISDEIKASLAPELPEHIRRYQQPVSMEAWEQQVQVIEAFIRERPNHQRQHILEFFDLGGVNRVELNVSDPRAGYIQINSLALDGQTGEAAGIPYPWQGTYFQDVPVTITAVPRPGYQFIRWEGLPEGYSATEISVELMLTEDIRLTAQMKPDVGQNPLFLPTIGR